MSVPLLDLNIQNLALETELKAAFERVLRSGKFILGPEVDELEGRIAEMVQVRHGIGVSSGTDAILLALMALEIGPGDEVLCPTFTFFATAGCVARVGATPIFVDSCPVCFNLDVADAARKVTAKTRAIIPVHLFGQAADMDAVIMLAKKHEIAVIEDAAQSLGAEHNGRPAGSIGNVGIFSFFPSKNLGGFGDGGMLVTDNEPLAARARSLRAHGAKPKYYHKYIGGNFRLDPLQAALLSVKFSHYPRYTENRRANAAYYTDMLTGLDGVAVGGPGGPGCQSAASATKTESARFLLPATHEGRSHIWNQYTIRVLGDGQRDALQAALKGAGIGNEVYYPLPLHRQECFAGVPADARSLSVADALSKECVSIPIYPELARSQQDEVVEVISEFVRRRG